MPAPMCGAWPRRCTSRSRASPPLAELDGFAELQLALHTRDSPPLQEAAPWIDPGLARVVHGARLLDLDARCPSVADFAEALRPFAYGSDKLDTGLLEPIAASLRGTRAPCAEPPSAWSPTKPMLAAPVMPGAEPPKTRSWRRPAAIAALLTIVTAALWLAKSCSDGSSVGLAVPDPRLAEPERPAAALVPAPPFPYEFGANRQR